MITGGMNLKMVEYLTGLVPERSDELRSMERVAHETGFPIIGPAAGYFMYQIARIMNAQRVFELGSGYGYSTAWFARAVQENGGGVVYHVVWDDELSRKARRHLEVLGYSDIVEYKRGEAVEALRDTEGTFDLIFNDIDKVGYPGSLDVISKKLRSGGVLIVDNALWGGEVLNSTNRERNVMAIRELTRMLTEDPGWISTIVPIRDGLLMAFRQSEMPAEVR